MIFLLYNIFYSAEVVELADALRSGRSGSTPVRVQIPPSAPTLYLEQRPPVKVVFFLKQRYTTAHRVVFLLDEDV